MGIRQSKILEQHRTLKEKITNDNLESNLIVFDMPIQLKYREVKSYLEQLEESTDDELTNILHNVLYIPSLDIKITSEGVKNTDNDDLTPQYCGYDIRMYKYFTFDDEPIPEELVECVKKIRSIEQQINLLQHEILIESNKISKLNYVKKKLSTKPENIKTYMEVFRNLLKKIY